MLRQKKDERLRQFLNEPEVRDQGTWVVGGFLDRAVTALGATGFEIEIAGESVPTSKTDMKARRKGLSSMKGWPVR